MRRVLTATLVFAACGYAAESSAPAPTHMVERGKVLFADEFKQKPTNPWKAGKGKWEVVDGRLRGSELKSDMHGATLRRDVSFTNAVIEYSFKLDGCRQTTLSINGAKGHLCRVLISPTGFTVQKDSTDHGATNKAEVLDRKAVAIKPGVWHTLVVELNGKEMLACVDGEHVAYGSHDLIEKPKGNVGLTVAGDGCSFKDFLMSEATPKSGWEETKAKLLAGRKAAKK